MRGVRFTKAEVARLHAALELYHSPEGPDRIGKSILDKLEKAEEPAGVAVEPLEDALVKAAMGKVVKLEGGHARASRQAKNVGATPELATLVGAWMARQGWLHGPQTLIDVLNKWHQWLPKARATEPPPGLEPGFATGQGTPTERPAAARRRPKAGFR